MLTEIVTERVFLKNSVKKHIFFHNIRFNINIIKKIY